MNYRRLALCGILLVAGCRSDKNDQSARDLTNGGDPVHGRQLVMQKGCITCHEIPGINQARGLVGPPLEGIGARVYIGGVLENTPENMIRWVMNPQAIDPKSAMPATGLSSDEARDVAAFLYTLR